MGISEGAQCDERCPVGRCEKFADGEEEGSCRWFFGSVEKDSDKYTPSHYRCKVDHCSKVPNGDGMSGCITEGDDKFTGSQIVTRSARMQSLNKRRKKKSRK